MNNLFDQTQVESLSAKGFLVRSSGGVVRIEKYDCGALHDITVKLPAHVLGHLTRVVGFRVERYRMELFGLCGKCVRTNGAKRRNGQSHSHTLAAEA